MAPSSVAQPALLPSHPVVVLPSVVRLFFGPLPDLAAVHVAPMPGTWAVELASRGPVLCSLGFVAVGLSSREEAEAWRDRQSVDLRSRFMLIVRYSATADELADWATAPLYLDVGCYLVEKTITADDGHKARLTEGWFMEKEAAARVELLATAGIQATSRGRWTTFFCATPESLRDRDDFLARINGDRTEFLREVSSRLPDAETLARDPRVVRAHGDKPWMLLAYLRPEVLPISDHYRETVATYAEQVQVGWFGDQNGAREAGRQLLATDPNAFGFLTWFNERDTSTTVIAPADGALLS